MTPSERERTDACWCDDRTLSVCNDDCARIRELPLLRERAERAEKERDHWKGAYENYRDDAEESIAEAEAAARELERELSELRERHTKLAQGVWGHPDDWQRPSFSGEEGTEG